MFAVSSRTDAFSSVHRDAQSPSSGDRHGSPRARGSARDLTWHYVFAPHESTDVSSHRQDFCESEHGSTLRVIPSFFIRKYKVERFKPKRDAAPRGPETTHRVSFRVARIGLRSPSPRVWWQPALGFAGPG